MLESLTQFGVAGLMGGLWLWERAMARKREDQLEAAHRKLLAQRQSLRVLVATVRRNTAALERFDQTNRRLCDILRRLSRDRAA